MSGPIVRVLHLGRPQAMGESRRVATWTRLFERAGATVHVTALLQSHPTTARDVVAGLPAVATGTVVPEMLAWSPRGLMASLDRERPQLLVCVTSRAYHPALGSSADRLVLDFVDRLSVSYAQRATIAGLSRRAAFGALAACHRRFERRSRPDVIPVAAGVTDARALGARWLPVFAEPGSRSQPTGDPLVDILFIGNLAYPPNVAAVERLAAIWPRITRARPGTTCLLAGHTPTALVRELAASRDWELVADFDDLEEVCARARLAVAPLSHAAGIQMKVLDAAAHGLAQVVSAAAVGGMPPGFPARVADSDDDFVAAVMELLEDDEARSALGASGREEIERRYTAEAWLPLARDLLGGETPHPYEPPSYDAGPPG